MTKMTKTITEIDTITGEVIERNATAEELAQFASDEQMAEQVAATMASKAAEKDAVLAKLGLTAEEAAALLR